MIPELYSKYITNFLLILIRAGLFISLMPVFGNKNFPMQFKIGFAIAIALILAPIVEITISRDHIAQYVIRELIFTLTLGLIVRFTFIAVDVAGQAISHAMHLSIATVFNPDIGHSTELARFYTILAMLLFFTMDAHHDLIYIFVKSFEVLPEKLVDIHAFTQIIVSLGSRVFLIAIKLGAPVLVAMLILSFLLGFIYKAAPQINIFFISIPLYLFVGFLVILISIPVFFSAIGGYYGEMKEQLYGVIGALQE